MTSIRTVCTFCTFCGDVTLRPDEIVIAHHTDRITYEFDCPVCETPMQREANGRVVAVLIGVGCEVVPASPPPDPIRQAIDDSLQRCRESALLSDWAAYIDSVETIEDLGCVS